MLLILLLLFQSCTWCMSAAQPPSDIGSNDSSAESNSATSTTSIILFVIVGGFFFSGVIFVTLRRNLGACCFGIHLNGGGGGGVGGLSRLPEGLSREVIGALPTYLYKDVNEVQGLVDRDLECAICLNEFEDHQALRLLPECRHIFHPQCIDPWLLSQATCPVCRSTILEPSNNTSDASDDDQSQVIIMDPCPLDKSPIHEDLEHGGPSQAAEYYLMTTTEETGTTQVVTAAVFAKSHSTGHSPYLMEAREPERLGVATFNQNPTFVFVSLPSSPVSFYNM